MQSGLLDSNRFGWSRFDWDEYCKKDEAYGKKLINVALNSSIGELKEVLKEGTGYYHFPNDISSLTKLQEEKPVTYFFLMSSKSLFYQYESIV